MKTSFAPLALALSCMAGVALGDSILAPVVDEQGRMALMHIAPGPDGSWLTEQLAVPTLQGLEPNVVDVTGGKLVLSSVVTVRRDRGESAEGQSLTWVSACYDLPDVLECLRTGEYLLRLSDHCPYDSHTAAALRRELFQKIEETVAERADRSSVAALYSQNPANLFSMFGGRNHRFATVGCGFPLAGESQGKLAQLYVCDLEEQSVAFVSECTDGVYSFENEIRWGRYVCYLWEDRALLSSMWSENPDAFDRSNRGRRAFVYDAITNSHVFESPAVYKGAVAHPPEINPQGTHVLFPRTEAPLPGSDPGVLDGPVLLEIYDLANQASQRITGEEEDAFFIDWVPDGAGFLFGTRVQESSEKERTTRYYLGSVDGARTELDWKVSGLSDPAKALVSGRGRRVWLSDGRRFVTLLQELVGRAGDAPRYRIRVVLSDLAKQRSEVVAEYEFVDTIKLHGREAIPLLIP